MGLVSHGLAAGLGYLLGRPDGRARLAQVGRQAADLSRRPEVMQLRERATGMASDQAQAAKQKIMSLRSRNAHFPASADVVVPSTGFGGTTVMEDSEAAMLGMPATTLEEPPTPHVDRP